MLTYTGRVNEPGKPLDICCKDIAVQMGRICRYCGAIWLTDLTHTCLAAMLAPDLSFLLYAHLMVHDVNEVVSGEVPTTWKTDDMRVRQDALDVEVWKYFNLIPPDERLRTCIKEFDIESLKAEATHQRLANWCDYREYRNPGSEGARPESLKLIARFDRAGFLNPIFTTTPESSIVRGFERSLILIREGRYEESRNEIEKLLAAGDE